MKQLFKKTRGDITMGSPKASNIMFVQQLDKLPYDNLAENVEFFTNKLKPKKIAAILHNKDLENGKIVEPHIHLVMQFANARSLNNLAKLTNQPVQQIEKWDGDVNNAYSYLLHQTTNSQHKHQYKVKEVIANFDYISLIKKISKDVAIKTTLKDSVIINNTLDLLYDGDITLQQAEEMLSGAQYGKAKQKLDAVYKKRMEKVADEWRQEMRKNNQCSTVIWLWGESSTGKTKLAKEYAAQFGDSHFFSGSSRDPFQRYEGQNIIILDELRPKNIDYSDLLKILDPYNDEAMAASRYFDKPLTANYFIITSPYSPKAFYDELVKCGEVLVSIDKFEQLARRLLIVQKMTITEMSLEFYDSNKHDFVQDSTTIEQNTYSNVIAPSQITKNEAVALYNSIVTTKKAKKPVTKALKSKTVTDPNK